jgi:hypothetical protein
MKYCQEITELMERSAFERIPLSMRMAVAVHLFHCKPCKRFAQDSKAMDELLAKRFKVITNYTFSASEKEKLKKLF